MKEFSAYKELVLDRDKEGGTWIARIYNRIGPARMLHTKSGREKDYEAARDAATKWADAKLEKYRNVPSSDKEESAEADVVGILNLSKF